jgi:predicted Fe-Mo cluster-binding NifX family protein
MIVALSVTAPESPATIDIRFGRAPWFLLINTETSEERFMPNPSAEAVTGAGTGAVQILADAEVDCVIGAEPGPKATEVLNNLGIDAFNPGTISDANAAIAAWQEKKLERYQQQPAGLYRP